MSEDSTWVARLWDLAEDPDRVQPPAASATGATSHDAVRDLAEGLAQFSAGWEACLVILDSTDSDAEVIVGDAHVSVIRA